MVIPSAVPAKIPVTNRKPFATRDREGALKSTIRALNPSIARATTNKDN